MIAKKCDRCGRFYEHYEEHKWFDDERACNGVILAVSRRTGIGFPMLPVQDAAYDLCPECMEKLMGFLEGGKDVSN